MSPRLSRIAVSSLAVALLLIPGAAPAVPDREEIPSPELRPTLDTTDPATEGNGLLEAEWGGIKHPDIIPLPDRRQAPLDLEPPTAFPNPSKGAVTVRAHSPLLSAEVYDVNGRRLAELPATGETAVWDGRDGSGREVVPGVYFARVRAEGSAVRTVRIVRR